MTDEPVTLRSLSRAVETWNTVEALAAYEAWTATHRDIPVYTKADFEEFKRDWGTPNPSPKLDEYRRNLTERLERRQAIEEGHEHCWVFWWSCGFGGARPADGVRHLPGAIPRSGSGEGAARMVTDEDRLFAWRYGSYRLAGHRPEVIEGRPICVATRDGYFCGRRAVFVRGFWKHYPRPAGR